MRVIGTAGHVDHGKSALVAALTGTHPDRLKEEQAREMTIDLGFAWMTLDNGESVGIVDVPGHRDFIENMLSGVGGIDAALFVIAADEGVMPQTREHLAILNLLKIHGGVIALNKVDLIADTEWLDLVEEDVRGVMKGTVLADAPILRVSARSGQGIAELKQQIANCLSERPPRMDFKKPRLNIDRVFSIAGFGSVVTGTLLDGTLKVGDEIEVLPRRLKGRIRGLQSHKNKEDLAVPGSRTAVNITGIELQDLRRGDVVCHPGDFKPTQRMDLAFDFLSDATLPLKHNDEVKFFIGAVEVLARVRLLGADQLLPGESGWLQLELREPAIAVKGDRYILRRPSPGETLGGGEVIDPHPGPRHKRFSKNVIEHLRALKEGSPAEIFLRTLEQMGASALKEVAAGSHLADEIIPLAVHELLDAGQVILLEEDSRPESVKPDGILISAGEWQKDSLKVVDLLEKFHMSSPLRRGFPREEFKSRLKMNPKIYARAYARWLTDGLILEKDNLIYKPGFKVQFTVPQEEKVNGLLKKFDAAPFSPPSLKDCQVDLGMDLFQAVLEQKILVQVSSEVVFNPRELEAMRTYLKEYLSSKNTITAAEFRDYYQTSRKYALAVLEYFDAVGFTLRDGDNRRLKSSSNR
ncbi:MAG: selenocysteine-specific translation elongation factor [Anaerolineaceae bacterium]